MVITSYPHSCTPSRVNKYFAASGSCPPWINGFLGIKIANPKASIMNEHTTISANEHLKLILGPFWYIKLYIIWFGFVDLIVMKIWMLRVWVLQGMPFNYYIRIQRSFVTWRGMGEWGRRWGFETLIICHTL